MSDPLRDAVARHRAATDALVAATSALNESASSHRAATVALNESAAVHRAAARASRRTMWVFVGLVAVFVLVIVRDVVRWWLG